MKTVCIAALMMAAAMTSASAPAYALLRTSSHQDPFPKADQLSEAYTFEQYEAHFTKRYANPAERQMRKGLFEKRLGEILSHNRAGRTWKKGVNHLTDLTDAERKARRGNLHPSRVDRSKLKHGGAKPYHALTETLDDKLPLSLDWREVYPPVLTAVKDQGGCGNCWAHAAAEGIESVYAIDTGILNVLSQQEITSCTPNPDECGGTGGCAGATAELAYDYLMGAGITQEWQYCYTSYAGDSGTCKMSDIEDPYLLYPADYFVTEPRNDPVAMMKALNKAPLAISVDASGWDDYESGVFTGCDYANNISMDHAVQVVGYGGDFETGMDYWIVRNSWGAYWGEAGFIKLYRERGLPECGWNVDWQDGAGCLNGPTQVWACGQCGILYDTVFPAVSVS